MSRFIDLTGRKFGRLTVVQRAGHNKFSQILWDCVCECGKKKCLAGEQLKSGNTKSCGCYNRELIAQYNAQKGHPLHKHPLWKHFKWMKVRCNTPSSNRYPYYGGRGIRVEWETFDDFLRDMGDSYKEGLSIDRIDNDGNYCKENCRWATPIEQMNNTSRNHRITFNGETLTAAQWSRKVGTSSKMILRRLKAGWSVEDALLSAKRINQYL
jgi:hypothetical protein